MITITNKAECCGCGACSERCPKHCIKMKEDDEGFLYPVVDTSFCVNCGLCEAACPILNKEAAVGKEPATYAAVARKKDVRMESSSGGLFSVFAEAVLERGGVVFGAAFDNDFSVHHIGIQKKEELIKLRGSKYVQSRMEGSFKQVENYLLEGRYVLFTGTCCQIAGLKQYLNGQYEKLITIDVLCHGVPSPKVWRKYLEMSKESAGSEVEAISFRNKDIGWRVFSMKLAFSNGSSYGKKFYEDRYMQLFLKNISLRPSCYHCKFKDLDRCSDLTIGDFWGVEKVVPDMDDDKGTSLVMIQSEKGRKLFASVKSKILLKAVELDQALPKASESRRSVEEHPKRAEFFACLDHASSKELDRFVAIPLYKRYIDKIKRMVKKVIRRK